jgi:ABC-type nickel/cobalt efflux system permease component RcnA
MLLVVSCPATVLLFLLFLADGLIVWDLLVVLNMKKLLAILVLGLLWCNIAASNLKQNIIAIKNNE